MSRQTRITLFVAGFILTVGLCPVIAPDWSRKIGLDYGPLPGLERASATSQTKKWTWLADAIDIDQEKAVKDTLVADLVAGRLTLAQVTDDFMLIAEREPDRLPAIRCLFAGETDRERVARSVLLYARKRAESEKSEEVVGRLDGEFQAMFRSSVPDPARPGDVVAKDAAPGRTKGGAPLGTPPPFVRSLP
jgi:hypothetical protein